MQISRFGIIVFIYLFLIACDSNKTKTEYPDSIVSNEETSELNNEASDSLAFENLIMLIDSSAKENELSDSLSFLIIPLDAVCPHCRDKAINALVENRDRVPKEHYVIISATSNKGIRAFFEEKNLKTPEIKGQIFLDGSSEAFKKNLIFMHPTVYYTFNKQVVRKVISYPTNIDTVLEHFFKISGRQ